MKGHDTIVVGWNKDGEVVFAKTFDVEQEDGVMNEVERLNAVAAIQWVQINCDNYVGGVTDWLHKKYFKD